MPRLRILLTCPRMTKSSTWSTLLSQDPDVELVAKADGAVDTLIKTGNTDATVVVINLPSSGGDPGLYSHLLEEYPHVKVIAVSEDGRSAIKYEKGILKRQIRDTSLQTLKDLFKSLWMEQDPVLDEG